MIMSTEAGPEGAVSQSSRGKLVFSQQRKSEIRQEKKKRRSVCCDGTFGSCEPRPEELSQVVGHADQGPLGLHILKTPHRPLPKLLVVFDLTENRLDDGAAAFE